MVQCSTPLVCAFMKYVVSFCTENLKIFTSTSEILCGVLGLNHTSVQIKHFFIVGFLPFYLKIPFLFFFTNKSTVNINIL